MIQQITIRLHKRNKTDNAGAIPHYEVCEEDTCIYMTFTYDAAYKAACQLMEENNLQPWNITTTEDALQYAKMQG